VTKISLNKKDRIIASEIINCRERRLSNKRFEAIQKEKQINRLIVGPGYDITPLVRLDAKIGL